MADIIDRFIDDLRASDGDMQVAEARFRQREGGLDGGYIRKTLRGMDKASHVQRATQAIGDALANGSPLAQAFAAAGVGRTAGYRHLKRKIKLPQR